MFIIRNGQKFELTKEEIQQVLNEKREEDILYYSEYVDELLSYYEENDELDIFDSEFIELWQDADTCDEILRCVGEQIVNDLESGEYLIEDLEDEWDTLISMALEAYYK